MKTLAHSIVATALLLPLFGHATVWRVNNAPNNVYDADFSTLTEAAASAEDGDTLHVEASPTLYDDLVLTKRLVLIGPGYFLGTGPDLNDHLQANTWPATVHAITLQDGSQGSVIEGLTFSVNQSQLLIENTADIVVRRNRFDGTNLIVVPPANNIVVSQNYILGTFGSYPGASPTTSLMITNNYMACSIIWDPGAVSGAIIANNVFDAATDYNFFGSEFANNIIVQGIVYLNNNTFHNNVASGTFAWDLGDGNVNNVDMTGVFVPTGSLDTKWRLQPSIYTTYATDGGEVGIYGGVTPYVPSGIANIPTIYELVLPGSAVQGGTLPVTLSTRSNN